MGTKKLKLSEIAEERTAWRNLIRVGAPLNGWDRDDEVSDGGRIYRNDGWELWISIHQVGTMFRVGGGDWKSAN